MTRSKTAARQPTAVHRHKQRGGHLHYDRRLAAVKDLVAKPELPRSKHHSYFEFAENTDKKKKIEFEVTNKKEPSTNFTFVPIGNPELTSACKELSREKGALIYIVSSTKERNLSLGEHVHRIGYHFRTAIVEEATSQIGDTQLTQGTHPSDKEDGDTDKIPETQEGINKQADAAIRDLFPRIPNTDREMGAVFNGKPVVGLQEELSLSRRVQLAVIAHIRHTHTRYDLLLRETTWENARRAVESLCLDILVKWRGDEETGRDQLDEVLREIVVISDSENGDESNEDTEDEEDDDESDDEVQEVSGPSISDVNVQAAVQAIETLTSRKRKRLQRPDRDNPDLAITDTRPPPRQQIKHRNKVKRKTKNLARRSRRGFKRYEAWQEALKRRQGARENDTDFTTTAQVTRENGQYPAMQATTFNAASEARSTDQNMLPNGVDKYGRDLRPALVSGSRIHNLAGYSWSNEPRIQAELPQTHLPEKQLVPEKVVYEDSTPRRGRPEDNYGVRHEYMDLTSPQHQVRHFVQPQVTERQRLAEHNIRRQVPQASQDTPLPSVEPVLDTTPGNLVVFPHYEQQDRLELHDRVYVRESERDQRPTLFPRSGADYADGDALRNQIREPYTRVVAESSRAQLNDPRQRSHIQYVPLSASRSVQPLSQHDRLVREMHPRDYLQDERIRYADVPALRTHDASHPPSGTVRRAVEQDATLSGLSLENMRVSDHHPPHQMVSSVHDGEAYPRGTLVPPSLRASDLRNTGVYLEPRNERPDLRGSLVQYSLPTGYRERAVPDQFPSLSSASHHHLHSRAQISDRFSDRSSARQHVLQYVSNENVQPNSRHLDAEAMNRNRAGGRAHREFIQPSLGMDEARLVGYPQDHIRPQMRYASRQEDIVVHELPQRRTTYAADQREPSIRGRKLPIRDEIIVLD